MASLDRPVDEESTLQSPTQKVAAVEAAYAYAEAAERAAVEALSAVVAAGEVARGAQAVLTQVQQAYIAIEEMIANGGIAGQQGEPGESAYAIAVRNGFVGSEFAWLQSLKGAAGDTGADAYEVAVSQGFIGDRSAWLQSLKGEPGTNGLPGEPGTAATISVGSVSVGTETTVRNVGTAQNAILEFVLQAGPAGPAGQPGQAATLSLGNVSVGTTAGVTMRGTASARILDFVLQPGPQGPQGPQGVPGQNGADGRGVPPGGVSGQVLVKTGVLDYQYGWQNPPLAVGTELFAKASDNDYDTQMMQVQYTGGVGTVAQALNITNVFTKNPFGRLRTMPAVTEVTTVQCNMEISADFVGIRIGIPNLHTAIVPGVKVSVAVTNELKVGAWYTHPFPDGGYWIDLTWNDSGKSSDGGLSVDLPPRLGAERQSVVYSDILGIKSIGRVEPGKDLPLLMVRIQFPNGSIMSSPYTGFFNWRLDGNHRVMRVSRQNVAGVDVKADYTTTAAIDDGVTIPIVQYISPRQGHQLMLVGDSTTEGLGGTVRDFGAVQVAATQLSTKQYPIEYYNCGLHAQGPLVYSNQFNDYVDEILPSVVFYQPYSINDVPAGGMNSSSYSNIYASLTKVVRQARDKGRGAKIFLLEALPCNPNFRNTGAGDQLRRELNVWLQTFTGPYTIPGYANALSGPENQFGQTLIKEGFTDDGVHPNGAGYDAMAQVIKPFIEEIMPEGYGETP